MYILLQVGNVFRKRHKNVGHFTIFMHHTRNIQTAVVLRLLILLCTKLCEINKQQAFH